MTLDTVKGNRPILAVEGEINYVLKLRDVIYVADKV